MPLIDVECTHGHVAEVMRPLAMYPATPACPDCGATTTQIHLPPATRWSVDPVVVFRDPTGQYRFPGDPNGLYARKCEREGFERIELRNAADVRRFEHAVNQREFSRSARRAERLQQNREAREGVTRGELRRLMPQMSAFGRSLSRAAMSRNDNKPRERGREAGFHVDVYSNDRSNRDDSRDPQGRRRRD